MKNILHIIASPRGNESRTLKISKALIERLRQQFLDVNVDELNVFAEPLPEMNITRVKGKYMLMSGEELNEDAEKSWKEIVAHINRFLAADIVIVSTPMWNFSLPYQLKHYIDIIVQPGFTFKYGANGPEGLAKGKKLFVVSSHGGDYSEGSPFNSYDKLKPYLQQIFGFIGVVDQTFISAQPMDSGDAELRGKMLEKAVEKARQIIIQ
ncbi:MAG: FMN-dependent NADH-azoreductase [Candidatus Rifleibacteriota bacterium]